MRGGIAVHLSVGTAARSGVIAREPSRLFSVAIGPDWLQGPSALPVQADVAGQPHSVRTRRSPTTTQVGVSHAMLPVLVTHRARDPPIWTVHLR